MKKLLCLLLAALMLFSVTACSSKTKTTTETPAEEDPFDPMAIPNSVMSSAGENAFSVSTEVHSEGTFDDTMPLATSRWETLVVDNAPPALNTTIEHFNETVTEDIRQAMQRPISAAKATLAAGNHITSPFGIIESISIPFASEKCICVTRQRTENSGGIDEMNTILCDTFDCNTGKHLELSDIWNAEYNLSAKVIEAFEGQGKDWIKDNLYPEWKDKVQECLTPGAHPGYPVWSISPEGFTVHFNPRDIGPFSSGAHHVTFLYADDPQIFTSPYLPGGSSETVS